MVDMNYWLGRKYALLQQQADAGTTSANAGAVQANAAAEAARASAGLTRTQTGLLPAESLATIAQTRANTRLLNEQAAIVAPESAANIANTMANTGRTNIDSRIAFREGLRELPGIGAVSEVPAIGGMRPFRLTRGTSDDVPPKRPGESEYAYQTRIGQ